jgi:glycosyl hydrolase family 42 (putative beta-galactosidase)
MDRLAVGLLLIALAAQLAGSTDSPHRSALPMTIAAGYYGVNQDLEWDPPEQVGSEIRLMKAAGVQWLRLPLRWNWLEPQRGHYRWDRVDPVVAGAAAAGLNLLAVLGGTPAWSSGMAANLGVGVHRDAFPPRRAGDFADYVSRVVHHFRGRVQAYELFNEPNSSIHWRPAPDAARFIELLCAGYRAAKDVDPESVIVAGGLNGNGLSQGPQGSHNFLSAIYAGQGARCFDVLAIHPFAHPVEQRLAGLQAWIDETRRFMLAHGDRRPLWLTEVGWSSGPRQWGHSTITEEQQAEWVRAIYHDLRGAQKVFWYNFKEVRRDPSDPEFEWGWLRYDLAPKPAYWSFFEVAR